MAMAWTKLETLRNETQTRRERERERKKTETVELCDDLDLDA